MFDVDAIGLVNIVRNLNHGLDIGGNPMGSQTALLIGVGANPGALNMDEEIRRFEWKVEAGAEYVVTQPVFDLDLLEKFLKRIEHVRIPVICGIWPLTSFRNAEFMVNELRVPVPEEFMERMRRVDNAEKAREEGVAIAREMVARVRHMVQGVQLSAPFGRYQMALDVAEAIGPALRSTIESNGNRPGRNRSRGAPAGSAGASRRRRAPRQSGRHPHRRAVHAGGRPLQPARRHAGLPGQGPRAAPLAAHPGPRHHDGRRAGQRAEQPLLHSGAPLLAGPAHHHRAGFRQGAAEGHRQHRPAGAAPVALEDRQPADRAARTSR